MPDTDHLIWRKSTRSYANGCVEVAFGQSTHSTSNGCVEVGQNACQIFVRDSKHPDGPVLQFTPHEWQAFLGGVRAGEFDRP
jgi:hypothetical protein